jgi:hypothetical protein
MTKLYTLLLAGTVLMYSCKSASKSYQKGNYKDAIELGVRKMQKDPYDYETRDLVQRSYNYAVISHEDQIRILNNSKSENRFERIYQEYTELQNLYDIIHQYPAVSTQLKSTDYSDAVNTYRDKSAQLHEDKAEKWMEEGTKKAYREAYTEFNLALRFLPDDSELRNKRDKAYDAALIKVVIGSMQNSGGYQYSASYQLQNFQSDMMRTLSQNMSGDFIRFYSEMEARGQNIKPDQLMELNMGRISFGQPNDTRNSREISKEVVMKEIVYKVDSVVKQYGTVKANITQTKRTIQSQGDLFITLRDPANRILWNDRYTAEYNWQSEFATYTGDERALSEADKKLVNLPAPINPTEDQIMQELMRQIKNNITGRLRSYYVQYQ